MSKRTSTSKTKDNGRAGDGPEGRPSNRPRYQPRSRPIGRVVARPKGANPCRGGRGGSTSASRNVDWFADDRGDVGEYLDESLRPEATWKEVPKRDMDLDLTLTASTGSFYSHDFGITSSYEVYQAKAAQERELGAKEQQEAAEEREREAEERVKELEEQVKDIANMLKTLKPPPSPPPIYKRCDMMKRKDFIREGQGGSRAIHGDSFGEISETN
ncbi:hypothetical protein Tco_0651960 [Tanacetum coccineum]|uniref:Uncharacterized protein n=1 Tax=Tanacetum coccineum TaxID=301880 RepID=A0ABQ4WW82_9ASTR